MCGNMKIAADVSRLCSKHEWTRFSMADSRDIPANAVIVDDFVFAALVAEYKNAKAAPVTIDTAPPTTEVGKLCKKYSAWGTFARANIIVRHKSGPILLWIRIYSVKELRWHDTYELKRETVTGARLVCLDKHFFLYPWHVEDEMQAPISVHAH